MKRTKEIDQLGSRHEVPIKSSLDPEAQLRDNEMSYLMNRFKTLSVESKEAITRSMEEYRSNSMSYGEMKTKLEELIAQSKRFDSIQGNRTVRDYVPMKVEQKKLKIELQHRKKEEKKEQKDKRDDLIDELKELTELPPEPDNEPDISHEADETVN